MDPVLDSAHLIPERDCSELVLSFIVLVVLVLVLVILDVTLLGLYPWILGLQRFLLDGLEQAGSNLVLEHLTHFAINLGSGGRVPEDHTGEHKQRTCVQGTLNLDFTVDEVL
ncbi:hypothetical protein AUEXF2481DRAFT_586244 [Aureobasidium subglaciale EXF-2481]|uniref:Uncharacterized protein n=1 Tax=Aureobasidium subglaciale (strain EXF-2481) TaxID=1043005 RepID=A0A074YT38_AURSE|nr:uncharacterized protein AUEXF2481DRAFT_586244 [Aureobasidium subglaciale EXF-2481]KEQ97272.1 hypothetical protein AUEXF2481DRAFT_586244 [Aureobasidium subglaciale EXF-2481]